MLHNTRTTLKVQRSYTPTTNKHILPMHTLTHPLPSHLPSLPPHPLTSQQQCRTPMLATDPS
jgi:hypothetical protein